MGFSRRRARVCIDPASVATRRSRFVTELQACALPISFPPCLGREDGPQTGISFDDTPANRRDQYRLTSVESLSAWPHVGRPRAERRLNGFVPVVGRVLAYVRWV